MDLFKLLTLFVGFVSISEQSGPFHEKVVLCETMTEKILAMRKITFQMDKMDWNLCSHVTIVEPTSAEYEDPWKSGDFQYTFFEELMNLRKSFSHLKVLLSIRPPLVKYLEMVDNPLVSQTYMRKVHDFVFQFNLDGLNVQINLEANTLPTEDFKKLIQFKKQLYEKLKASNLSLTLTMSVTKDFTPKHYDFLALSTHIDYLNLVQTYTYKIGEIYTMHRALTDRNITQTLSNIDALISSGFPPSKIVMFISLVGPFFWVDFNNEEKFRRFLSFYDICTQLMSNEGPNWLQCERCNNSGLEVLHNRNENLFIVFESLQKIANEVRLAMMQLGIAGFSTSPIHADDQLGECEIDTDVIYNDFKIDDNVILNHSMVDGPFPGLRTINAAIRLTLAGEGESIFESRTTQISIINSTSYFTDSTESNEPNIVDEAASLVMFSSVWLVIVLFVPLLII